MEETISNLHPSISVALAAYCGERFIEEQLRSIFEQTVLPSEIVIVDDFSTDDTPIIVNRLIEASPVPIRFYRNVTNIGYRRNYERAIGYCTGDIIALCDQDDYWFPGRLEAMQACFLEHPQCGLVIVDGEITDRVLSPLGFSIYSRYPTPNTDSDNAVRDMVKEVGILGCTMAFRSDYLQHLLPLGYPLWGHDHWIAFILAGISELQFINKPLMYYRRHDQHSGDDAVLDRRISRIWSRTRKSLSIDKYHNDVVRWTAMLTHLEQIHAVGLSIVRSKSRLEDAIELVRKRQRVALQRYELRCRSRLARVIPAIRLLQNGSYTRYTRGYRTVFKDIIA